MEAERAARRYRGAAGAEAAGNAGTGNAGTARRRRGTQQGTQEAPGPIEVRCFGGFDVVYGEQRLSATGQTGPRHRSWEVLAYLAAQPSEVVSTEKLLAAVWPGLGRGSGGQRFRGGPEPLRGVLLHQVPGLTGPLVLRDRVGRTCRLDGAALVSDVHAFAALCREGRRLPPAAAAAAYERPGRCTAAISCATSRTPGCTSAMTTA